MATKAAGAPHFREIEKWTGKWRWNAKTAVFTDPKHQNLWQSQVQDITVKDGGLIIRDSLVLSDGSKRQWTFDGALDGVVRPIHWDDDGSVMTMIAFAQIDALVGTDGWFVPGIDLTGSEHFRIWPDNVKVWGCVSSDGGQYPYFEEWDRIDG